MKIDRDKQREMLEILREDYPGVEYPLDGGFETSNSLANFYYLHEHGLVDAQISQSIGGDRHIVCAVITAAGLDFLEDDGGLSAILNTVTVRFDEGQLRQIIESKIALSDIPEADKTSILDRLKGFSGEAFKTAVSKLIELGIEKAVSNPAFFARIAGGG